MNDFEQNKFSEAISADNELAEQPETSGTNEIPQPEASGTNEIQQPETHAEEIREGEFSGELRERDGGHGERKVEFRERDGGYRAENDAAYAAEYGEYLARRKYNRTPLILALFGLMFSVFYGAGIVFGIIALVMGAKRYRVHKSEPLKWAIVLSIVCIALSLAFIFAVTGSAVIACIKQTEQDNRQGLMRAFAREWFGR